MVEVVSETLEDIIAKETWTNQDRMEILAKLGEEPNAANKMTAILSSLETDNPEPGGSAALKIGISRYILCRFAAALEVLADATDNKDRRYFQAMCYKHLFKYDKALEELQRARDKGWDEMEIKLDSVELNAMAGNLPDAAKSLPSLEKSLGTNAHCHYLRGLVNELSGNTEQAGDDYLQALQIDPNHGGAMFHMAYFYDLRGDDEQALEMYKRCTTGQPVYTSAFLNLAVLYEDDGKYDKAAICLKRVLAVNPNHERAKMFLKDVELSKTMYYDEDQAKRLAYRNAILDIPVTDFELSVRARNCLKKMNIRTLGDLVGISEISLMGYKNFGETSLKEIRAMLEAKGLTLGQDLENDGQYDEVLNGPDGPVNIRNEGVLATPIEQVQLSKRVRKVLDTMEISVLGDLTAKSEAELLASENFGQTSLNEIRQRLSEYGLTLSES